jgi:hypothetical protein
VPQQPLFEQLKCEQWSLPQSQQPLWSSDSVRQLQIVTPYTCAPLEVIYTDLTGKRAYSVPWSQVSVEASRCPGEGELRQPPADLPADDPLAHGSQGQPHQVLQPPPIPAHPLAGLIDPQDCQGIHSIGLQPATKPQAH